MHHSHSSVITTVFLFYQHIFIATRTSDLIYSMVLLFAWNLVFHITIERIFTTVTYTSKFNLSHKTKSCYFKIYFKNYSSLVPVSCNQNTVTEIILFLLPSKAFLSRQVLLFGFMRCNRDLLEIWLRKQFHNTNKNIFFIYWLNKASVLQIFSDLWKKDIIKAVFRGSEAKLLKSIYWAVWVSS